MYRRKPSISEREGKQLLIEVVDPMISCGTNRGIGRVRVRPALHVYTMRPFRTA
jgi:hypothetical protein